MSAHFLRHHNIDGKADAINTGIVPGSKKHYHTTPLKIKVGGSKSKIAQEQKCRTDKKIHVFAKVNKMTHVREPPANTQFSLSQIDAQIFIIEQIDSEYLQFHMLGLHFAVPHRWEN